METIRDMLYLKSVERRLGRGLTKDELDMEQLKGEVRISFPNGNQEYVVIPRLEFPWEVLDDLVLISGGKNKLVYIPDETEWKRKLYISQTETISDAA